MTQVPTQSGLNSSFLTFLSANLIAVFGQILSGLAGFLDIYFVTRVGQDTLTTYSFLNGWNIIGIAFLGGVMQSFLIIGGRNIGTGNRIAFGMSFQAALIMTALTSLAVQSAVALVILSQGWLTAKTPPDVLTLALILIPGSIFSALTVILRMRAIVLAQMGLFIAIPALAICVKLAAIALYLNGWLDLGQNGVLAVGAIFTATTGLTLLLALALTLVRGGRQDFRKNVPMAEITGMAKLLVFIGMQIGIVVAVELAVLGLGQLIVWFLFPERSGAFGVAVQLVILIETVAVALSQVATVVVATAISAGRDRVLAVIRSGLGISVAIHGLILAGLILTAPMLAPLLLAHDSVGDPEQLATMAHHIVMVAAVQFLMGVVIQLAAILRGIGDISRPVLLVTVNYLGVGLGSSALLLQYSTLREDAVWAGIILSLISSVIALAIRIKSRLQNGVENDAY